MNRVTLLQRRPRRAEPHYVTGLKGLLYALALVLYVRPLASAPAVAATALLGLAGMFLARLAHLRQVRLVPALIGASVVFGLVFVLGAQVRQQLALSRLIGASGVLLLADVITFGFAALAAVFTLRILAHRARILSLLEVLFIAGAVVGLLSDHRNRMINRPRVLSDWAWSLGFDPTAILFVVGTCVALLSVLLFLREQPLLKLASTLGLLLALGGAYYLVDYLFDDGRIIAGAEAADALGLSGDGKKDGKKEAGGRGGGKEGDESPFKDDYSAAPPQPVAIAILRDDYEARDGVIYFRQRVLSDYNGLHLTADRTEDRDVITSLPAATVLEALPTQAAEAHTVVPTTMYLLVDHPQPPALTHASRIKLVENPNPRQFVAAYEVESQVLSVPPLRLLGRRASARAWDEPKRRHYTKLPDDPRYRTLAEMIVRGVDPRFADDDLARAFAIKRYLERQGFYTRKSTHASMKDPTASFLFGSLRGYCVHFAHAAVYLMRSLGIASRVALGYAVQVTKRAGGSTILIMSDRAHAWPEIYLDGIGWVTFDIYPERTDMPLATAVDYDLERLLGELARNHPTAGVVAAKGSTLRMPWAALGLAALAVALALLGSAFGVKISRRMVPRLHSGAAYHRLAYRATLDRLGEVGLGRRLGETRERHAARVSEIVPALLPLTAAHMAAAFGSRRGLSRGAFDALLGAVERDLRRNVSGPRRMAGLMNPLSWLWSR